MHASRKTSQEPEWLPGPWSLVISKRWDARAAAGQGSHRFDVRSDDPHDAKDRRDENPEATELKTQPAATADGLPPHNSTACANAFANRIVMPLLVREAFVPFRPCRSEGVNDVTESTGLLE